MILYIDIDGTICTEKKVMGKSAKDYMGAKPYMDRIAVINRWSPWWMSINEYAYDCITNVICRPLSKREFKKIPKKLQPFMVHLIADLKENLTKEIVNRSYLSIKNALNKKNN